MEPKKVADKNLNYNFKDLAKLVLNSLFNFKALFAALISAVSGFEAPFIRT